MGGKRRNLTSAGTEIGVAPVREEHGDEWEKGRAMLGRGNNDDDGGNGGDEEEEYSVWW